MGHGTHILWTIAMPQPAIGDAVISQRAGAAPSLARPVLLPLAGALGRTALNTHARLARLALCPSALGVALAVLAFQQSLAPSLLLRSWYFQGVVSGLAVVLGYALGAGLARLVGWAAGP